MTTYIIIAVAIIALLFIPIVRTILRWIIFLPVALFVGFLFQYLDIPNLIASTIASWISPTLGLIFNIIDMFIAFIAIPWIAKLICPSTEKGWYIAVSFCILLCVYNLIFFHVYELFPLGPWGAREPLPPIIWWHAIVLFLVSLFSAWIGKDL